MIYSPETETWFRIDSAIIITLIIWFFHLVKKNHSLCSRWSFFITSYLPSLPRPCPCCPCPRWALTACLLCLPGSRTLPHPLPPPDPISLRSQATAHSCVGHNCGYLFHARNVYTVVCWYILVTLSKSYWFHLLCLYPCPCLCPSLCPCLCPYLWPFMFLSIIIFMFMFTNEIIGNYHTARTSNLFDETHKISIPLKVFFYRELI